MEFKSQICTTREQSEKLLSLGLKRETADMCYRKLVNSEHHTYDSLQCATPRSIDIPAWSLHRLIEMYSDVEDTSSLCIKDISYKLLIFCIGMAIHCGLFNKDYLKEK